jgi:hypothetical protein
LDTPYAGSVIENNGTDIYATKGNNSTDFWVYIVSENKWYSRSATSLAVYTGADLVNGGDGYLYLLRGNNSRNLYRYDIEGRKWYSLADAPSTGCSGAACNFYGEQKGATSPRFTTIEKGGPNGSYCT